MCLPWGLTFPSGALLNISTRAAQCFKLLSHSSPLNWWWLFPAHQQVGPDPTHQLCVLERQDKSGPMRWLSHMVGYIALAGKPEPTTDWLHDLKLNTAASAHLYLRITLEPTDKAPGGISWTGNCYWKFCINNTLRPKQNVSYVSLPLI